MHIFGCYTVYTVHHVNASKYPVAYYLIEGLSNEYYSVHDYCMLYTLCFWDAQSTTCNMRLKLKGCAANFITKGIVDI